MGWQRSSGDGGGGIAGEGEVVLRGEDGIWWF